MKAHYSYFKIIAHMIQTLNEREHVPRYSNHQLSATLRCPSLNNLKNKQTLVEMLC